MRLLISDKLKYLHDLLKENLDQDNDSINCYPEGETNDKVSGDYDFLIHEDSASDIRINSKKECTSLLQAAIDSLLSENSIAPEYKIVVLGTGSVAAEMADYLSSRYINTIIFDDINELANSDCDDYELLVNFSEIKEIPVSLVLPEDLAVIADFNDSVIRNPLYFKGIENGIRTYNHIDLLTEEYCLVVKHVFNKEISQEKKETINKHLFYLNGNVVLIGMPTAGKTTISSLLGEITGRRIIETDDEIIKVINMPIRNYFVQKGEASFRKIETEVIRSIDQKNVIISTGGGAVLNHANLSHLAANGIIIWLQRDIELMITDDSRPIASSRKQLEELYEQRKDLYRRYGDIRIENNRTPEETVQDIVKMLGI